MSFLERHPVGGQLQRYAHRLRPAPVRPRIRDPYFEPIADEVAPSGGNISGRTQRRMPRRYRQRRRRGGRRRFRRNYRRRAVQPYKVVRQLKTVTFYPFDAGAGTISVGIINVNSANDPFAGLGTGQPLGHDQYAALYERSCVIGGRVTAAVTSTDGMNPIVAGVNINTSSSALTVYEHYAELPHTSMKLMTPEQDKITLGLRFGVGKYFAGRKLLSDDRLTANIGSDPTDLLYAHFFVQSADKSANPANCLFVITLYQTVVYFKPKVPARS